MSSITFLTNEQLEEKTNRFLGAQATVFQQHQILVDWCLSNLDGAGDQQTYELAKRIFKDVASFERLFDEFEVEFWNYVLDVHGGREYVDNIVTERGISDHKEYFFSKISDCVSILGEVVTEFKANGYEWEVLSDIDDSLESLYDVSEELIEADISQLAQRAAADVLELVPPQRIAPIEVFSTGDRIRKKVLRHTNKNLGDVEIVEAMQALREIINDTVVELRLSNCDPRILRAVEKCLDEIKKGNDNFSPIRFGIFVGVSEEFKEEVEAELNSYLSRQFMATLIQCSIFLRNFRSWISYRDNQESFEAGDSGSLASDFEGATNDLLFDDSVREAVLELARDKGDFPFRNSIDYSIFQSISNILSEVCRIGIRYSVAASKFSADLLIETSRDLMKVSVGLLAVSWLTRNMHYLISISEKYSFFQWLKPVLEFVKVHFGG